MTDPTEYRVAGVLGGGVSDDPITVYTQWFGEGYTHAHMTGIMIGLESRGWRETEIQERDP